MSIVDSEIVIVTYHSVDDLGELLGCLPSGQKFVVVDNASNADGAKSLVANFPTGRWLDGGNVGYARAANLGARTSDADILVFANADTRPSAATFSEIVTAAQDENIALVGARTVSYTGVSELGIAGWEPTVRRAFVYAFALHKVLRKSGVYARPRRDELVDFDWIDGAFAAVKRTTFLELGGFDERYFVYNEDMEYGVRAKASGRRIVLRTDLEVLDSQGVAGGGRTRMYQQRGASLADFLSQYNGRLRTDCMRLIFAAGGTIRAVWSVAVGRDIDSARNHLAYVRGLITRVSPYTHAGNL